MFHNGLANTIDKPKVFGSEKGELSCGLPDDSWFEKIMFWISSRERMHDGIVDWAQTLSGIRMT